MPDAELRERRRNTRNWSEDLLLGSGFRRIGNTSLFENAAGGIIVSPGVGPGRSDSYWFDIRDAILKRIDKPHSWVLLRVVDRGFVFLSLSELQTHLNERTRRSTKAGAAYGFRFELGDSVASLKSSSDSSYTFSVRLLDRAQALREIRLQFPHETVESYSR